MSDLRGKLSVFEPISVLQLLNLSSATGRLDFKVPGNSASVYFERGGVMFARIADRPQKLGAYLVAAGLVEQETVDRLARKRTRKKLGVLLVESGAIDADALRRAVEDQIKDVIYEIVRWRDGKFSFRAGLKPKRQDIFIDIPLDHLVLEGLKRLDEEREQVE